jgi:hypothetical protein
MCLENTLFKLVTSFILFSNTSNDISNSQNFNTVNMATSAEGEVLKEFDKHFTV